MPKALLILGAAVWPGGQPSPALARRARHGARLYLEGGYDLVIASGGLGKHAPAEAEVMAKLLHAEGVPRSAILQEGVSTTTAENIAFSRPLLQARGITDVTVVTDYFHLPRAVMTARRHGLTAHGACPTEGLRQTPLRKHLYAIAREAVALPVYWLRGQR